jgi:hypothetical protein
MHDKITGPLFKCFGSKWLSSKAMPAPRYDTIIEPFAGGAGYSLRHFQKRCVLWETDAHVRNLWIWLIDEACEKLIREIPIDIAEGTDIRTLGLSWGQALLLKNWQRTNNVGDCWTISPWGNKPGQWTANTRARVASEAALIRHWKVALRPACDFATWFIDPPYQYNYQYRQRPIDYAALAGRIATLSGQIIVCEALCPKTGQRPTWLPFRDFASRVTSRRKTENHHHSKELIWESGVDAPNVLP